MNKLVQNISTYIQDLGGLIFPELCPVCDEQLKRNERDLCLSCSYKLPKINQYHRKLNIIDEKFWGRLPVVSSTSWLSFDQGNSVQKLMHQFKYNSHDKLAITLGWMAANDAEIKHIFKSIDYLIPIPLHKTRLRQRGYNQSYKIARGIQEATQIIVEENQLQRLKATSTQTKKSKYDRWKNAENTFQIKQPEKFKNKHVMLVDDVLTTGSTLEAAGQELLKIEACKISVFTLAFANLSS